MYIVILSINAGSSHGLENNFHPENSRFAMHQKKLIFEQKTKFQNQQENHKAFN